MTSTTEALLHALVAAGLLAACLYLGRFIVGRAHQENRDRRNPSCTCMTLRPDTEYTEAVVIPDANCPAHKAGEE